MMKIVGVVLAVVATVATLGVIGQPATAHAQVYVPVATMCVTPVVTCPMAVPVLPGSGCTCVTPAGVFYGRAF